MNKENFNNIEYNTSAGICRTDNNADNPERINYPNYRVTTYENTNDCRDLCDTNENCLGFSKKESDNSCHLYGTNFSNEDDIEGVGNVSELSGGNPDIDNTYECYKKNNTEERTTISSTNAQSINRNREWIRGLRNEIIENQDNSREEIQNALVQLNNLNNYQVQDLIGRTRSNSHELIHSLNQFS